MLLPRKNLVVAAASWLGVSIAALFFPALVLAWQGLGMLFLALALGDAWLAWRRGNPLTITRRMHLTWPVGVEQKIRLHLALDADWRGGRLSGLLFDQHPDTLESPDLPLAFTIGAGEWQELTYRVTPDLRGEQHFGLTHLRLNSPLGFWHLQRWFGKAEAVRVFPNFARVAQYALLAMDDRLAQMGILRRSRRGAGLDFHQLREYRRDDPPRSIDWKASARMMKLIAREYQDERDQQIIFLIDCGQRMRSRDDALSHFDHTLNAMLLLAYVALRQGDAVGFATFAHARPRFFPPQKSTVTLQKLLEAAYDLQPSAQTSDYLAASDFLVRRIRKRALVVLLTNLRDEDEATLSPAIAQLRARHLVLLASLRETGLDKRLESRVENFDDALAYAVALDYREARRRQLVRLRALGARLLETSPQQLPVALVNRYWELKRGGAI
ncbi:MAG: DUF58 domain-containing protein [Zoogloeaceae bacterium]|jgi:uncharacterized protein (DUF58 family)|nr:DUF58 domain-containing protein [Zoogloeaceae bacterium]